MPQQIRRFLLIGLCSFLMAMLLYWMGAFRFLEQRSFDYRARFAMSYTDHHPDIVLVLIDDQAIHVMDPLLGRWPWPRYIYGELIEYLNMAGARAQIFDILFTESQHDRLVSDEVSDDALFAWATQQAEHVYHSFQLSMDPTLAMDDYSYDLPEFSRDYAVESLLGDMNQMPDGTDYFFPFDELVFASAGLGFVDVQADSDGTVRHVDLLRRYQNQVFPSLSFAYWLTEMNEPVDIRQLDQFIQLGSQQIPIQDDGFLVKMKNTFQTYSAGAILQSIQALRQGRIEDMLVMPEVFDNKIVLIGTTAAATHDLLDVSIQGNTPGIFIHASILDNLISNDFYQVVPMWINILVALCITLLAMAIILFVPRLLVQLIGIVQLLVAIVIVNIWLFTSHSVVVLLILPIMCLLMSLINGYGVLSFVEGKERRKMRRMLSKYVSPTVLSEVMDKATSVLTPEVGAEEELTIFFSDIRQFTQFSESVKPEAVVLILNHYLTEMVDIIFTAKGTLDKFIGDAIMAFWGAPVPTSTHGYDAVIAALDMCKKKQLINQYFTKQGWPEIDFGIGIHTGPVILGNIGSMQHLDYTIIGDNVNLASRIEGLTKFYGVSILITQSTYDRLKDRLLARVVDNVQVKGKTSAIKIYEPYGLHDECDSSLHKLIKETELGFDYYLARDWQSAKEAYQKILQRFPDDSVARLMIERMDDYINHPPNDDWDGGYVFDIK